MTDGLDLEDRRKVFHAATGAAAALAAAAGVATPRRCLALAAAVAALGLASRRVTLPLFSATLDRLERPENRATFPAKGTVFFFAGCAAALALFRRPAAVAGILCLALGDAVSCMVGRRFGRLRHPLSPDKMVEGHLAGALAAGSAALALLPPLPAFASAAAGMFVEGLPLPVDDNLTVPLAAALVADLLTE